MRRNKTSYYKRKVLNKFWPYISLLRILSYNKNLQVGSGLEIATILVAYAPEM